jgi:hypothetical protein
MNARDFVKEIVLSMMERCGRRDEKVNKNKKENNKKGFFLLLSLPFLRCKHKAKWYHCMSKAWSVRQREERERENRKGKNRAKCKSLSKSSREGKRKKRRRNKKKTQLKIDVEQIYNFHKDKLVD